MLFDGLYGQNEIKKILTDLITGDRVGHAFVFCGPTGVGRKSFAKSFALSIYKEVNRVFNSSSSS